MQVAYRRGATLHYLGVAAEAFGVVEATTLTPAIDPLGDHVGPADHPDEVTVLSHGQTLDHRVRHRLDGLGKVGVQEIGRSDLPPAPRRSVEQILAP